MWTTIITSAVGLITSGVKGFFGVKEKQIDQISKVVDVINSSNLTSSERDKAIAAVITAESNSGYWLAAVWRPLLMVVLAGLVLAYALGFTTPNLLIDMPESSVIAQIFELLKIGVMGYMPLRTVDKIVENVMKSKNIALIVDSLSKK
jgi:hypothetical protein